MWFLSRMVIIIVMQWIAPNFIPDSWLKSHGLVEFGWKSFANWDGDWYRKIAVEGYEYAADGKQHNVAFFPLFPLLARSAMSLGLSYEMAAPIVNSLAFLAAAIVLYYWVKAYHGSRAARWSTAVMVWCPFSLFCTVAYTEGLFLLVSTASLRAYEQRQYVTASLWGALATATRANGLALIPTFLIVAWREKRSAIAYISVGATATGFLLFSLYCAIRFGDPLAFVQAQKGWQEPGFQLSDWWHLLTEDLLWRRGRDRAIEAITKILILFGGGYLIWHFRTKLNFILVIYTFCSIALILNSGAIRSIERFAYAIVSMSVALGLLLARHQRWGFVTLGLFALWLAYFSLRFTLRLWVA